MEHYATKIIACCITLGICLILPIGGLIFYARKHRGEGIVSAWIVGALGFFVPQMLIRLPILTALSANAGFLSWTQKHLLLYTLGLALTAGLFELAGRCAGAGLLRKNLTFPRALAAGLGHGGIEAILLIGLTYINNLVYLFLLQSGGFDALAAQAAAAGADTAQLTAAAAALKSTSAGLFLLAGLERVLTMVCQTCMTAMVFYGFRKKDSRWILGCLGIHFLLDSLTGIPQFLSSQALTYSLAYLVLAVMAALCLWILKKISLAWREEPNHVQ